jgi:hypothetical protein
MKGASNENLPAWQQVVLIWRAKTAIARMKKECVL